MLPEIVAWIDKHIEENEDPDALDAEDMVYLEQLRSVDDLLNFTDSGDGKMVALAADAAKALGQPREWIEKHIDEPRCGPTVEGESACGFGHSGLGIGGLAHCQEDMPVPSVETLERVKRMEQEMQVCRRCGENDLFDGAMFTTDPSSGYCDDCYG